MNYISGAFALFLFVGMLLYFTVPKKLQIYILLVLNIIFYTYIDWRYLLFLMVTVVSTYSIAKVHVEFSGENKRKFIIAAGVIINLAILIFIKFYNYFSGIINEHIDIIQMPVLKMIVPLGISFYTLQAISYCIDVYRGKIEAERKFINYAVYLSYFPTIVQGPITRYQDMVEQLTVYHKFDYQRIKYGMQLILYGLFKKMVIADRAALIVNDVFASYSQYSKTWILVGVFLYSIQIYTDFSGCVDVCRGTSQILGIEIINNFKNPYFAVSIKDFWHRWHISLSSWLRDYVYIPLGGNRKGKVRKQMNLLITFLVSGLWHGVGIHYLVWGAIHGLYQIIGDVTLPIKKKVTEILKIDTGVYSYKLLQQIITFCLVSFGWIFFRANGTRDAINLLKTIGSNEWFMAFSTQSAADAKDILVLAVSILSVLCVSVLQQKFCIRKKLNEQNLWFRWLIYFIGIFSVLIFGIYGSGYSNETFIYMQF